MSTYGRTILRIKFGSHLYGTATPASDLDFKSIYVPNARDILLGRVKGSIATKRPKAEGEKNYAGEVDEEAYSLQRFLGLVTEGQTVAMDVLFAPEWAWTEPAAPEWQEILANRHRLLTRKSKAFIGYVLQQASKYGVRGSRVAASRAALALLEAGAEARGHLAKVGELEDVILPFVDRTEHTALIHIPQPSGQVVPHFEVCNRKLPFTVTIKEASGIVRRMLDEYGKRALQAESNQGVDWKALSHAVRVATQGLELLATGHVTFPAPNAAHILDIKAGRIPFKDVGTEIEALLSDVQKATASSLLPDEVDREWIDTFVARVHGQEVVAHLGQLAGRSADLITRGALRPEKPAEEVA